MGVLNPGSAHARPSALPPIDVSRNFPAHVSAEITLKHLPQPLKSHIWCFGPLRQPISPFVHQKSGGGGLGGSQNLIFHWKPNIFVSWEPIKNFGTSS